MEVDLDESSCSQDKSFEDSSLDDSMMEYSSAMLAVEVMDNKHPSFIALSLIIMSNVGGQT